MVRPAMSEAELDEFRDRVCTAALELFKEGGLSAVSMRAIARRIGCSHTLPYRYFEGRGAIIAAMRTRCYREFLEHHIEILGQVVEPREQLLALARGYARFARERPSQFSVMFELDHIEASEHMELRAAIRDSWDALFRVVQRCVEAGDMSGDERELTYLLWSGVHGVLTLAKTGKIAPGWDAEAIVEEMVSALMRAHGPGAASRSLRGDE